jgi:hypothetical protein
VVAAAGVAVAAVVRRVRAAVAVTPVVVGTVEAAVILAAQALMVAAISNGTV